MTPADIPDPQILIEQPTKIEQYTLVLTTLDARRRMATRRQALSDLMAARENAGANNLACTLLDYMHEAKEESGRTDEDIISGILSLLLGVMALNDHPTTWFTQWCMGDPPAEP